MKSTPSQLNMHYEICPKKLEARHQTIVETYKEIFNKTSIPANKQYWAICGRCSYEKGIMAEGCEPDQLIKAKLIKPNQFYGIEICPAIQGFNKKPNKSINWYLGDCHETRVEYCNHHKYDHAIVTVDIRLMPK